MDAFSKYGVTTADRPGTETGAEHGKPQSPRIFQIFYLRSQLDQLEPDFIAYSNVNNPRPEWCEYFVFRKEYHVGTCDHGITGFMSWKFRQKTGISGAAFRGWIEANPGYDVYFINPFPDRVRKRRPNVWYLGDRCHPGMSRIAQALLDRAGYKINLLALQMEERHIAYCNYWVGTPEFWRRYMEFSEPLYDLIENGLSDAEKADLLKPADSASGCCYIPYIFERLFSTLLCIDETVRSLQMHTATVPPFTWGRWAQREVCRPYKQLIALLGRR